MTKIAIKSEDVTSFGGIFSIMEAFEALLSPVIDGALGKRGNGCGYSYSEIVRSLMCVYMCGGSPTSRIKGFVFRFVSVPAKWIRTARQYVLISTQTMPRTRTSSSQTSDKDTTSPNIIA